MESGRKMLWSGAEQICRNWATRHGTETTDGRWWSRHRTSTGIEPMTNDDDDVQYCAGLNEPLFTRQPRHILLTAASNSLYPNCFHESQIVSNAGYGLPDVGAGRCSQYSRPLSTSATYVVHGRLGRRAPSCKISISRQGNFIVKKSPGFDPSVDGTLMPPSRHSLLCSSRGTRSAR